MKHILRALIILAAAILISALGSDGLIFFALPLCAAGFAIHSLQSRRRAHQG